MKSYHASPNSTTTKRSSLLSSRLFWIVIALAMMWWWALAKKTPPSRSVNAPTPPAAAQKADVQWATMQTEIGRQQETVSGQPSSIDRTFLESAARDPFTAYQPPLPPAPKPQKMLKPVLVQVTPAIPLPQAAPAPTPPSMNLRYVGQMTAPDGNRLIYASLGNDMLTLTPGASLPNGYHVTKIEPRQVILTYAPLSFNTTLLIPEPPRYEIR